MTTGMLPVPILWSLVATAAGVEPQLLYEAHPRAAEISAGEKLFVDLVLTNQGDTPIQVCWGDYAHPQKYQFKILHKPSRRILPAIRIPLPGPTPSAVGAMKSFREIPPGESVEYTVVLAGIPGANAQAVFWKRPGTYTIAPTLRVIQNRCIDPDSGRVLQMQDAWTGTVEGKTFSLKVREGEDADGVTFNGSVVDHDGRPVAGAHVLLNQRRQSISSIGVFDEAFDVALTDQQGEFDFVKVDPAYAYRVVVSAKNLPSAMQMIPVADRDLLRGRKSIRFRLKKPRTVRIRVTDEDDRALSHVRVSSRGFTGADGRFEYTIAEDADNISVDLFRSGYIHSFREIPAAELGDREWHLEILRRDKLRVKGRAQFTDGSPVAGRKMRLLVKPVDAADTKHARRIEGQTDRNGNFEVTLSENQVYRGTAIAFENGYAGEGREWRCAFDRMQIGQPLNLTFNNQGRILVALGMTELPPGYSFTVSCTSAESSRTMTCVTPPVGKSGVTLTGLTPGRYDITVRARNLASETWREKVVIPDTAPFRGRAAIQIPELRWGGVKATFLLPDGRTPAAGMNFYVEGAGPGRSVRANAMGEIQISDILEGRLLITPSRTEGRVAEVGIAGHKVVAGQETDLGTIRLRSVNEEFGWVEGTLKYDDGYPVPAVHSGETFAVSESSFHSPSAFHLKDRARHVSAAGRFRLQVRRGRHFVTFGFRSDSGPSFFAGPSTPISSLIVPVNVDAGKTLNVQPVLNRTDESRSVTVTWDDEKSRPVFLTAAVENRGLVWVQSAITAENADSHTFTQLPAAGDCVVIGRQGRYETFLTTAVDRSDGGNVELKSRAARMITLAVEDVSGNPVAGCGVKITTEIFGVPEFVCNVPETDSEKTEARRRRAAIFREDDSGTMQVGPVSPRRYNLVLMKGDWQREQQIVVESDKPATIHIVAGNPVSRLQAPGRHESEK